MSDTFITFNPPSSGVPAEAVIFEEPNELIICNDSSEVGTCLDRIDAAIRSGYFAAGFFSYELGYHFLDIPFTKRHELPLICFGIFETVKKIPLDALTRLLAKQSSGETFSITGGRYSLDKDSYFEALAFIKDHLEKGNTYQVNYTFKYKFDFSGSMIKLFLSLVERQPVPYGGLIHLDRWDILSLSPELFFSRKDDEIMVRPMKGTICRGTDVDEDTANERALSESTKDRAENIMIVDLLRNDLGKISVPGSVSPSGIFDIEKYETLFQMTSTVKARLNPGISWRTIIEEIFPSGSVTGAPKKRTMEIIQQLENEDRNIYTGSMGYILPSGQSLFNVAIRTVLLDNKTSQGEMGIGSGIVYDSDPLKEYDESLLKGSFMTSLNSGADHKLIETMLWEEDAIFLEQLHLRRLAKSADHFSFEYNEKDVKLALQELPSLFDPGVNYRVRLLLNRSGEFELDVSKMPPPPEQPVKVTVSDIRTDKTDHFLYHKTTKREIYTAELERIRKEGCYEVLFLNCEEEVTEGAISNIIMRKGEEFFTPPLSCGLLCGTYREHLIETGSIPLKEKVLRLEDLKNADELFIVNSVMKMVRAELVVSY